MLATVVDTDALWHAAAYAFAGAMVFIAAFALAIYARDRAGRAAASSQGGTEIWSAVMCVGLIACLGVFALGIWAMTQKPA
jgi:cytosine/uracil/thiamine/allantoin permease